jgi:hypothetical protein
MIGKFPLVKNLTVPGQSQADLTEVVTSIEVSYSQDQVAELSVTFIDPGEKLTRLARQSIGAFLRFDSERWQVGSVEAQLTEFGSVLTMRGRDPLAKKLRKAYKSSAEKKVSPGDWVKGRVSKAGGSAIVQPSSKRATIAQSKNESVMEVLSGLTGELDWSWVSHSDKLWFASAHYAWQGKLGGLKTWPITWKDSPSSDAMVANWSLSDDDTGSNGELELELQYDYGKRVRPWERIQATIPGANGVWLVRDVSIVHDGFTPVSVTAFRPNKPSPKAGSSSKE